MSLSALSISRPITVLMFYTGVVLLGVVAFLNLSVDFLPPIKIPPNAESTLHAFSPVNETIHCHSTANKVLILSVELTIFSAHAFSQCA
jgi:hypothetical protein